MVREALSFRIAFLFKEGSIFTISTSNEVWLETSKSDSRKPDKNWIWGKKRGVFVPSTPHYEALDLVLSMIDELGKPELILPWEDWDRVSDQFAEADDEELIEQCKKFEEEIVNFGENEFWSKCNFALGEDYLPKDCDYVDFEALVEDLEEENWIIVWDECCGTCASGSISDARESEPEKADSPAFVIYGQNADNYFSSDGSIRGYMFTSDDSGGGRELELAKKHGFKVAKDGDYEGIYLLNPS